MTPTLKHGTNIWVISITLLLILTTSCATKYQVMKHGEMEHDGANFGSKYSYHNDSLNLDLFIPSSNYLKKEKQETIKLTKEDKELLASLAIIPDSVIFLFKTIARGTVNGVHYPKLGGTLGYCQAEIDSSLYQTKAYGSHNHFYRKGSYGENIYFEYVIPYQGSFYMLLFINNPVIYQEGGIRIPDMYDYVINQTLENIDEKDKACEQEGTFLFSVADSIFDKGNNYLAAEYLNRYMNCTHENNPQKWGVYIQALATYYSFSGQNKKAEMEFILRKAEPEKPKALKRKKMLDIGKENQYVLINEAHHIPRHRYFVGSLLQDYYDLGFRYLGLEALFKDSLDLRGYLDYSDGVYTREPVMGNLIREAQRMGYNVFNYEDVGTSKERELNQVQGIKAKVYDKDPNGKALILAGWSHINEDCKERWMACLLNEEIGINPYTINQTELMPELTEKGWKSGMWFDQENSRAGNNDMMVKNTLTIENNCFSLRKHSKIKLSIPDDVKIVANRTIVVVYYRDEFEQGGTRVVPTYTHVLENNERIIKMELCEGAYIVQIKDINGDILFNTPIKL